jgi:hypothetical protein
MGTPSPLPSPCRFDFISPAANLTQGDAVKVLLGLILGIVIGAAGFWYFNTADGRSRVEGTTQQIGNAAKSAGDAIHEKLKVLDLRPEDIKEDLARSGQVVRRQARDAGKAIADSTADARTTAAIKAKFLGDRKLSALSISVNTTAGVVTLSGTAPSAEAISHAMLLAMETDGVREVISTLQVKPPAKQV